MVRWSKLPPSRHSGIQLSLPAAETANWQYCIPPSTGLLRPPPPQASSGKMRWVAQKLDTLQVQRAIRPRSRQRRRRRRRRRQSCTSSRISLRQSSPTARSPRAARNNPAGTLQLSRWFTSAGSSLHPGASRGDAEPTLASICRRGGEANISLLHHKVDAAERPKDARTHDSQSIGSGVSAEGVETRCLWCAVAEGRRGVSLFGYLVAKSHGAGQEAFGASPKPGPHKLSVWKDHRGRGDLIEIERDHHHSSGGWEVVQVERGE